MIKTINNSIKSTVQEKSECKYSDKNYKKTKLHKIELLHSLLSL